MKERYPIGGLAIALAAALAVRAGEPRSLPEKIAPPSRIPQEAADTVQPGGNPVATASIPREVRRAVVADAARRFEVAESAVVLSGAEQVTWSDGSLGCPQPGMFYTQVPVPGYRLTASTAQGNLLYHTDMRGQAVTCAQPALRKPDAVQPRTQPRGGPAPDR
ncbi:MAG TPA: hypothetical protein VF033_01255 [Steroidobacteraceae bacterium]|jgi:hypothetical protein